MKYILIVLTAFLFFQCKNSEERPITPVPQQLEEFLKEYPSDYRPGLIGSLTSVINTAIDPIPKEIGWYGAKKTALEYQCFILVDSIWVPTAFLTLDSIILTERNKFLSYKGKLLPLVNLMEKTVAQKRADGKLIKPHNLVLNQMIINCNQP